MGQPQVESTETMNTSTMLCKGGRMTLQGIMPRTIKAFDLPVPEISRRRMAANICLC